MVFHHKTSLPCCWPKRTAVIVEIWPILFLTNYAPKEALGKCTWMQNINLYIKLKEGELKTLYTITVALQGCCPLLSYSTSDVNLVWRLKLWILITGVRAFSNRSRTQLLLYWCFLSKILGWCLCSHGKRGQHGAHHWQLIALIQTKIKLS